MYSAQDKYEMSLRQAKVDIGQGRGNAMTNAVQYCLGLITEEMKLSINGDKFLEGVFEVSDKIFHYNQTKIEQDYERWLDVNEKELKLALGLEEEVIDGEYLGFPLKK